MNIKEFFKTKKEAKEPVTVDNAPYITDADPISINKEDVVMAKTDVPVGKVDEPTIKEKIIYNICNMSKQVADMERKIKQLNDFLANGDFTDEMHIVIEGTRKNGTKSSTCVRFGRKTAVRVIQNILCELICNASTTRSRKASLMMKLAKHEATEDAK